MERIRVRFSGGIAEAGQLHFYEYGRSQYATARFVATLEHFRRTSVVADRISSRSYIDMIVAAPTRGSFVEDILVPALQQGAATVISTPLSALISYVWHFLTPRREATDGQIVELAKIRLAEEVQKTEQERARAAEMDSIRQIAEGGQATTTKALEILDWALKSNNRAIARNGIGQGQIEDAYSEVVAQRAREREFQDYEQELEKIDEEKMNKLTSKLRSLVSDMSLPLKRSAEVITISADNDDVPVAYLTPSIARMVQGKTAEDNIIVIRGHVKSFDRDAGVAKVSSPDIPRVLSLLLPLRNRGRLSEMTIQALRVDQVNLSVRRVVDKSGQPTSLILDGIEFDED